MKAMKWALGVCLAAALVASSMVGLGFAEGLPSSKATAAVESISVLKNNQMQNAGWTPVMSSTIKTSAQKDLFVDVSLESGLYTQTLTKSRDMIADTSLAEAGIQVRVLVDGQEALPGGVTFARRSQELTTKLQGQITTVDSDGDGILEPGELESVAPEEVELILDTMNANSFNFMLDDVGVGAHSIVVEARIDNAAAYKNGSASAWGTIGHGSMTVEEVRLVKDFIF